MSLRLKVILAFFLSILITFLPLLYLMQTQVKSQHNDQINKEVLTLVDSKSKEVGAWLNERISEIKILLSMDIFNEEKDDTFIDLISKINSDPNVAYRFAVGGRDGIGYISNTSYIDVSERSYFKKLMSQDIPYVISDPVTSRADNKSIFLISHGIDQDGKRIGFINGAVDLDKISSVVEDMDVYQGFSWIMNRDLNIYTTSKEDLIDNYIGHGCLENISEAFHNKGDGFINISNPKGNQSRVFYTSIPHAENWIFCTIIDESKINEQIDNIIDIILKIGFLFIILSIIFSVLVSGSIVRPVQMLKNNMIKVSAGDLESYYISNTNDEISMLGMYFNEMLDNIKHLIDRVYKMEKQKREIELEVLQSQIKPHFLYNTLDTIQWKAIEQCNYNVADLIGNLSGFFRISLSDGKEFISIADEVKQVEHYLEIQKVRYSNKIDYEFMLDEGILDYKIPKLLIQPLVENSIYHGLKMKATRGYISIGVYEKDDFLEIKVEDNGVGMSLKRLKEVNNNLRKRIQSLNYGLYNVNERLNIYFGDRSKVEIYSEEDIGTTIVIKIPKKEEDNV